MPRPRRIVVEKYLTNKEVSSIEGKWIDESYMKLPVIDYNCDVYYKDDDGTEKLLLKFRKNSIKPALLKNGWLSYKELAKPSRGRGASAGPIDREGVYWKKRNIVNTGKWSTGYLNPIGNKMKEELDKLSIEELNELVKELEIKFKDSDTKDKETIIHLIIKKKDGISKMKVNNQVASNPIGFYESSKNFADLPCRLTHFTRTNYQKYQEGLPFIQRINAMFEKLIPDAYQKQLERANEKPHLKIPETAFSTITINRNFRTALHRDAGDFSQGFGNLTVIERGSYHGGYTVFPQFGVGVDVRSGDFLAMDVHQWHSNTAIYETKEDTLYNSKLDKVFNDNPEVGTVGLDKKYTRLTFVCYLREKILHCSDSIDPRFLKESGHNKIK
jgi:hypothetical protein|tara:strand:+ start:1097 stop:2254 length:1158 start_codon:yes stop_codon:yes gene_type:complete